MFNFLRKKGKNQSVNSSENELDMDKIPQHVALIMDGNGRWAVSRNLPRTMGHKAGVETLRRIIVEGNKLGIKYMTFYAFSTENWKRPKDEVNAIMKLLVQYLKQEINELNRNNVKINVLGDLSRLPLECCNEVNKAVEVTKNNTGIVMNVALNYGGRDEIVYAIKGILSDEKEGKINIDDIDVNLVNNYLYTAGIPDPDIIIRPSGEQRLSNFLLWQCAYSEFWYSDILWPDFTEEDVNKILEDYQKRNRRFGGV